jgi:hypothetical protein
MIAHRKKDRNKRQRLEGIRREAEHERWKAEDESHRAVAGK